MSSGGTAFPQVAKLTNGDLICTYANAGGSLATGGTDYSRSTDGGRTWKHEGTVLPYDERGKRSNFLKPTAIAGGDQLVAYGTRSWETGRVRFGERRSQAVVCRSTDQGVTWGRPDVIPMPSEHLEISFGIVSVRDGRLLAPAATAVPGQLGARVVAALSDDFGKTWGRHVVVFSDPLERFGFLEHKFADLGDGRLLATAWTVEMETLDDQPNSFAISEDGGETWSEPRSTGIWGQTLSSAPLDDSRLLVVYNRRYGRQGIVGAIVEFDENGPWRVISEEYLHDPSSTRTQRQDDGVDEMLGFEFGFPTLVATGPDSYLLTYWEMFLGECRCAWAALRVESSA